MASIHSAINAIQSHFWSSPTLLTLAAHISKTWVAAMALWVEFLILNYTTQAIQLVLTLLSLQWNVGESPILFFGWHFCSTPAFHIFGTWFASCTILIWIGPTVLTNLACFTSLCKSQENIANLALNKLHGDFNVNFEVDLIQKCFKNFSIYNRLNL